MRGGSCFLENESRLLTLGGGVSKKKQTNTATDLRGGVLAVRCPANFSIPIPGSALLTLGTGPSGALGLDFGGSKEKGWRVFCVFFLFFPRPPKNY